MKVFRCRICGETYLGEELPDKCPFCGAKHEYLVVGNVWTDENIGLKLTDVSKKNIRTALDLEVENTRFYLCAAKRAKGNDNELEGMFKRLSKVEREHASLLCKMLNISLPDIIDDEAICQKNNVENVDESTKREIAAVGHYSKFLQEATEPRVKTVFMALVEIEGTHIELDNSEKQRLTKNQS